MRAWILALADGRCGCCDASFDKGGRILEITNTHATWRKLRCATCGERYGTAEDRTVIVQEGLSGGLARLTAHDLPPGLFTPRLVPRDAKQRQTGEA